MCVNVCLVSSTNGMEQEGQDKRKGEKSGSIKERERGRGQGLKNQREQERGGERVGGWERD
jgi:hypothetical protein